MQNLKEINMNIIQNKETGDVRICFSEVEIKSIKDKTYIELKGKSIKQVANHLFKIAVTINDYVPEEHKELNSQEGEIIETIIEKKYHPNFWIRLWKKTIHYFTS